VIPVPVEIWNGNLPVTSCIAKSQCLVEA